MKLPQKWLKLFGGYENENEGVHYQKPDFKVSNDCCYWLKENLVMIGQKSMEAIRFSE